MKFLLATDGSEHSEGAARFLARFDLSALDRITVLHVVPGIPFPDSREPYHAALRQIGEEIAPAIVERNGEASEGPRVGNRYHNKNGPSRRSYSRRGSTDMPRFDCHGQ